jgi:superfamily II DNA or RNA helicase
LRRFISSRRDRYRIYRSTGGLCARCLRELGDYWEVDHICRWADGGDSRWSNLQPLCKHCHTLKTKEENQMNGPLKLESWGTQENGDGPLRRGHKDGCLVACQRFAAGERFTSVILPTRYGKSHLARFITLAGVFGIETPSGVVPPYASAGLFLTHRGFLSKQIIEADKWKQFAKLFRIENMPTVSACEITTAPARPQNIGEMGEQFIVCTIPMLSNNIDVFTDWVDMKRRNSRPPIIFADEAQFFGDGDDKKWGPALLALAEAGAFIMPMTATPMRADGETIPGFKKMGAITDSDTYKKYEQIGAVHPELGVVMGEDGNPIIWTKVETYAQTIETAELDAHVRVERQEAWFHKYLCRLQRIRVPIQMSTGEFLHELFEHKQRKQIGKVVRDEQVIQEFLDIAEDQLREIRKSVLSDAGVIVFVDATRDGDNHANRVAAMIRKLKRNAVVATQDTGCQENIDRFVEGEGDYLIVKNSAGAGLDCERIKVVVDLSSVRQFASCEQRWNRAGTPTNGKGGRVTVATLITPADCESDRIFEHIYTKQGGECREKWAEVIDTQFQPKGKEKEPDVPIFVEGVGDHEYHDTAGNSAVGDEIQRGKALISVMEKASGFNLGNITIPEGSALARILEVSDKALGLTNDGADPGDDFVNTTTKIGKLRSANYRQSKQYAMAKHGVVDKPAMQLTWGEIYDRANKLIGARRGDRYFIDSDRYTTTNDIQVVDAVAGALSRMMEEIK